MSRYQGVVIRESLSGSRYQGVVISELLSGSCYQWVVIRDSLLILAGGSLPDTGRG